MAINEKQRNRLFSRAEEVLGPDEAATMMELLSHTDALTADLAEVKTALTELRIEMGRQSAQMTRAFVGWMLASQTSLVGLVALIVSIGR